MSRMYPKPLYGPSAPGAAGVRSLLGRGGDFQRRNPAPGVVAKLQGEFSRIIVSGAEYVSQGRVSPTSVRSYETQRYQIPWRPSAAQVPFINTGAGQYVGRYSVIPTTAPNTTTVYQDYPGGPDVNYFVRTPTGRIGVANGSYYGLSDVMGSFDFRASEPSGGVYFHLTLTAPELVYAGVAGDPPRKLSVVPFLFDGGRTDPASRVLPDLGVTLWPRGGTPSVLTVPITAFTRPRAELVSIMRPWSVKGASGFFAAEQFFFPGPPTPGSDYVPKLWMFVAPGHDYSGLTVANLTALMYANAVQPPLQPTPVSHYPVNAGNLYNQRQANTMSLMVFATLPGGVLLAAYPLYANTGGGDRWHLRIARLPVTGGTPSLPVNEAGSTGDFPTLRVENMVHLGEGHVLAKKIYGFVGTNFDVSFSRSTDSGVTWTDFIPNGFDAPMLNQFFGRFQVHRSRLAGEHGVVLCSSWDPVAEAYFVYSSADGGLTWVRRGRIARPDSFYRIDSVIDTDGGGNFRDIVPGPDPARPVDVTLPDRYQP